MTVIIGLPGKKGAGKSTLCKFIQKNAHLLWPGLTTHMRGEGPEPGKYFRVRMTPRVHVFSLAGPLKKFCVDILGLQPEQVYGTEEQKNSLTRYRWEELPHYPHIVIETLHKKVDADWSGDIRKFSLESLENLLEKRVPFANKQFNQLCESYIPRGPMTARQVLQEFGTGVCRRMWNDVWNQAVLREISKSGVDVALIDDCRFPDEVAALQGAGGKVIRLTRQRPGVVDEHESERALDKDRFDWAQFDAVLDNAAITDLRQQDEAFLTLLAGLGLTPPEIPTDCEWSQS